MASKKDNLPKDILKIMEEDKEHLEAFAHYDQHGRFPWEKTKRDNK